MVTSIMKKRIIRERKKNRRQIIAVWITTCIARRCLPQFFPLLRPVGGTDRICKGFKRRL